MKFVAFRKIFVFPNVQSLHILQQHVKSWPVCSYKGVLRPKTHFSCVCNVYGIMYIVHLISCITQYYSILQVAHLLFPHLSMKKRLVIGIHAEWQNEMLHTCN